MQRFLIIQTAFIGDVVLATGIIEKLHRYFPDAQIDFLLRKGNEGLLKGHPFLHEVLIWDKQKNKLKNLWRILRQIRGKKYDAVINVQRFAATGILTTFSGAKEKIGFDKNPFSFLFTKKIKHHIDSKAAVHETERNHKLIKHLTDDMAAKPRLYPSEKDIEAVRHLKTRPYIVIAPASVWFTKQYPVRKWIEFIHLLPQHLQVYLIGGPNDEKLCNEILTECKDGQVMNLCGQYNFLQSAALQKDAVMNYVNDSAPLHFSSAMNASVTAVYCSTVPSFGFGPLSDKSFIIEIQEQLSCRPCSLHGKKACPLVHFDCAYKIKAAQLLETLSI
ncbi:MAG: glycosyltransferase family 9 protein [Chitinophagaceae bacterium]|nr:glycosyltransferase family 9 protein [Chitinophagaceae bacterium]